MRLTQRRRQTSRCIQLMALQAAILLLTEASANSFFNFNIKSQALSNFLNLNNQTVFTRDGLQNTLDKMLHVDFSGFIQTHLLGPLITDADEYHDSDFSSTEPLFEFSNFKPTMPNVFIGCHYDFARSQFGVTSVETTLRWSLPRDESTKLPSRINVRTQKGIADKVDDNHECSFQWDVRDRSPIVVKAEHTVRRNRFSCRVPIHRRIDYEVQIQSIDTISDQKPDYEKQNRDWWLPNISIRPMGTMESVNSAIIRYRPSNYLGASDLAIRFVVRRPLNWSFLTSGASNLSDDEMETSLTLELQELGARQASLLDVRAYTVMQQPLQFLRLSIVQQIQPEYFANL